MQFSHRNQRLVAVGALRAVMPLIVAACALLLFQPLLAQSTITVTTPVDNLSNNGDCSLREAIESANDDAAIDACPAGSGADTILLPAGIYSMTLPGASEDDNQTGDYDITNDMQIAGADDESSVIDGGKLDRILHVHTNAAVQIRNVRFTNGLAAANEPGGAILNEGALTIYNTLIDSSQSGKGSYCKAGEGCNWNAGEGGGIANTNLLTMTATIVRGNITGTDGSDFLGGPLDARVYNAPGGGIYSTGVMQLVQCEVTSNQAGEGAGVYNKGSAAIVNTEIFSNSTTLDQRGTSFPYGIGQSSGGGAGIFNSFGTVELRGSAVYNNATPDGTWGNRGPGGSGGPGAGILNSGLLLASNSTIAQNHTGDGDYGYGGSGGNGGNGGGLYNTGTAVLNNVTIAGNTAGAGDDGYPYYGEPIPGKDGAGAGINNAGTVRIRSTIVGANSVSASPSDCAGRAFVSDGFNLISASECAGVSDPTDHLGLAPHVGAVANYGGFAGIAPLFASSPAIDAGSCTDTDSQFVTHDQRGYARPQMNTCDIGAYEATSLYEFVHLHLPVLNKAVPWWQLPE